MTAPQKAPVSVLEPHEEVRRALGLLTPAAARWLLRELVADRLHSLPGAARAVEAWLLDHGLKARP